jgi:hypothetical protein
VEEEQYRQDDDKNTITQESDMMEKPVSKTGMKLIKEQMNIRFIIVNQENSRNYQGNRIGKQEKDVISHYFVHHMPELVRPKISQNSSFYNS